MLGADVFEGYFGFAPPANKEFASFCLAFCSGVIIGFTGLGLFGALTTATGWGFYIYGFDFG